MDNTSSKQIGLHANAIDLPGVAFEKLRTESHATGEGNARERICKCLIMIIIITYLSVVAKTSQTWQEQ